MSKTLRRIFAVPSKHVLCKDSKGHVTPISANHFSMSFETVPNAPINYYALPISRSVSSPLQVFVVFNFLFLFVFHPGVKWTLSLSLSYTINIIIIIIIIISVIIKPNL